MKNSIFLYVVFALAFLTGCSSDPTSVAKKIIEQKITTESRGYLKLNTFTKINATSQEVFGVKLYEVEYKITLEAVKGGSWVFLWNKEKNQIMGYGVLDSYQNGNTNHQIKEGEIFTIEPIIEGQNNLKITLKKTENGWVDNEANL